MNSVLIQIWKALITLLLLNTLQRTLKYQWQLSNQITFSRLNLFVKSQLQLWLDKPFLDDDVIRKLDLQLSLL